MTVMILASGGAWRGAFLGTWAEGSGAALGRSADIKSEGLGSLLMEIVSHSILNAKNFALKTGADNAVLY
jgi:hypothetical protein